MVFPLSNWTIMAGCSFAAGIGMMLWNMGLRCRCYRKRDDSKETEIYNQVLRPREFLGEHFYCPGLPVSIKIVFRNLKTFNKNLQTMQTGMQSNPITDEFSKQCSAYHYHLKFKLTSDSKMAPDLLQQVKTKLQNLFKERNVKLFDAGNRLLYSHGAPLPKDVPTEEAYKQWISTPQYLKMKTEKK